MNKLTKSQIAKLQKLEPKIISCLYDSLLNAKDSAKETGLSFRTIYNRIKKSGDAIGVENLTPLDIIKSKLIHLKISGKSLSEIKKTGGYVNDKSLMFLFWDE